MTSYVNGTSFASLDTVELRVLSALIQAQNGTSTQDELRVLRNDQAFDLGLPLPVAGD